MEGQSTENASTLGYCRYRTGYKNQLERDCRHNEILDWLPDFDHEFFSASAGRLCVKAGYAWDGASGPTLDTKHVVYPTLVHDVLYQAMGLGLMSRKRRGAVDSLFRRELAAHGMPFTRRWVWFCMVRLFGPPNGSVPKKVLESRRK